MTIRPIAVTEAGALEYGWGKNNASVSHHRDVAAIAAVDGNLSAAGGRDMLLCIS